MILDNDQAAFGPNFQSIITKADIIIDSNDANSYGDNNAIVIGNNRRLTTTASNNALVDNNANIAVVKADPAIVGVAGAKVILSAAAGRTLDINELSDFTGVDLQVGDPNRFHHDRRAPAPTAAPSISFAWPAFRFRRRASCAWPACWPTT